MSDDPRFRKTKEAIDKAFFQLLKKKDFESISVKDVTELAEINRGTFYRHYIDKYDWLEQCIDARLKDVLAEGVYLQIGADPEVVHQVYLNLCRHFDKNYSFYRMMLNNKGTHLFQMRFKAIIIRKMRSDTSTEYSGSMEYDFLLNYVASSITGILEWWIENNRPIPVNKMAENMTKLFCSTPL